MAGDWRAASNREIPDAICGRLAPQVPLIRTCCRMCYRTDIISDASIELIVSTRGLRACTSQQRSEMREARRARRRTPLPPQCIASCVELRVSPSPLERMLGRRRCADLRRGAGLRRDHQSIRVEQPLLLTDPSARDRIQFVLHAVPSRGRRPPGAHRPREARRSRIDLRQLLHAGEEPHAQNREEQD